GAGWTVDRLDIASVSAGSGTLTAAGGAYGRVTVTAKALGVSGTAAVTVRLRASLDAAKLPQADRAALDGASASDPAVTRFAYPYDQTVFPRRLLPAEMIWNGGQDGDEYRIHIVAPNFDLSIYATADGLSRYTMPAPTWNALTTSAAGASAAIDLRRLSAGAAYVSAHQTWNIADANLRGSIYYWAVDLGQNLKAELTARPPRPALHAP